MSEDDKPEEDPWADALAEQADAEGGGGGAEDEMVMGNARKREGTYNVIKNM